MNRKFISASLAMTLTVIVSFQTAIGANLASITIDDAKKTALALLPKESILVSSDLDDEQFELKFYNKSKQEKYVVYVSTLDGKLTEVESQLNATKPIHAEGTRISEAAAQKMISDEISNAQILSTKQETDDGIFQYKISFQSKTLYGKYEIDAQSGAIMEREIKMGKPYVYTNSNEIISMEVLKSKVIKLVPDGTITDVELESRNNVPVFKIEVYKNGLEYNLILNATTGEKISSSSHDSGWDKSNYELDWDYDEYIPSSQKVDNTSTIIDSAKAAQIAKAKAPAGATLIEIKLDYDDGRAIYEGKLIKGNMEYEFEIDALTGTIIDWDMDNDD